MSVFERMLDVFKLLLTSIVFFIYLSFFEVNSTSTICSRTAAVAAPINDHLRCTSTAAAGSVVPTELYHSPPWSSRAPSLVSHALAFELHHRTVTL